MIRFTLLLSCYLLLVSFSLLSQSNEVKTLERESPDKTDSTRLRLWATYYYIPQMNHKESGQAILDKNGRPTGLNLSEQDWCRAAIEGTVMIEKDGQNHLMSYHSRGDSLQLDCSQYIDNERFSSFDKTGRVLWAKSTGYGKGTANYQLYPCKSIAVDPSVIPIGSVIYMPEAVGISYIAGDGNKAVHDGYFLAVDVGSEIKGQHIDVFLGTSNQSPFPFIRSNPDHLFDAVIVQDQQRQEELMELHGR